MGVIYAYLAQLTVLEARESLSQVHIMGVGTGSIKKADRGRIMAAWRRQASGGKKKHRSTLASLSAPGLPIVEVKKSA